MYPDAVPDHFSLFAQAATPAPEWLNQPLGWGTIVVIFLLLLRGHLALGRELTHSRTETEFWRTAWQAEHDARRVESENTQTALTHVSLVEDLVIALKKAAGE